MDIDIKEIGEDAARVRRMQRIKQMQEEKQKQMMRRAHIRQYTPYALGVVALLLLVFSGIGVVHRVNAGNKEQSAQSGGSLFAPSKDDSVDDGTVTVSDSNVVNPTSIQAPLRGVDLVVNELGNWSEGRKDKQKVYEAKATEDTLTLGDEIVSSYAVMVDLDNRQILAGKKAKTRINPASMTKVLTVLVAAEHLEDLGQLDDIFTITLEITDYGYVNDCSSAGFSKDEKVTVRDLFYGTVLPSGADAAVALATYIAGDQEKFVGMMNDKLKELGLSDTAHMTNCVGIYDEDHYCTVYDMAMVMEAAVENEWCREVLATHTYTTSETLQNPEGITISNWFLRRIEDKDTGGEVLCGKTGYVVQSGNCAASYGMDSSGKEYICVTADASSVWRCIEDHAALYKQFAQG